MEIGIVGLGRMGGNMSIRLHRAGLAPIGFSRGEEARAAIAAQGPDVAESLDRLVARLDRPRHVWAMVPAGDPTESVIRDLGRLLDDGDLVVDGGNSFFRDSMRRGRELADRGIRFVDAGVSGGVWGLREGYCLMLGGAAGDVERLRAVLDALAPEGGWAHVGPTGAGHFTKMVHNGVEYGMLQAYGEGFEILERSEFDLDLGAVAELWRHGSVVRSWLLDLLRSALEKDPGLGSVGDYVEDSGEGRWTVEAAIEESVPATAIAHALFARFTSRQDESFAMKVIAALRREFGGHAVQEDRG